MVNNSKKNEITDLYKKETNELFYQRMRACIWFGIVLYPLFSLLDYLAAPHFFWLFLLYRILFSVSCILLLFVSYSKFFQKQYSFHTVLAWSVFAALAISLMIIQLGGFSSSYYVGIMLVMMICSTVLPLDTKQAALSAVLLYLAYVVPVYFFTDTPAHDLKKFLNNSFFFAGFIIVAIVQCREATKARKREFKLKMELEFYAQGLEDEVEKRAKKLVDSELRYQELFDNMVDIVILMDRDGRIVMANSLFHEARLTEESKPDFTFIDCIHPEDIAVAEDMFEKLENRENAIGVQFRIVNCEGENIYAESNATCIKMDNKIKGYQMVIRDITLRKQLESDLHESYKDFQSARVATILGLAKLAEYRDTDTGNHLERIREFTRVIALELSKLPKYENYITQEYIEDLYLSAILHDIGKVGIPDAILLKPGKLTREEFDIIKLHTTYGGDILKMVESQVRGQSFITLGKEIAYSHHEKWDGTGYPRGLKGEDIPLSTRLVALADVYDALTSKRSYKDAFSHGNAVDIILQGKGRHFDPDVADAFMRREDSFRMIHREMAHTRN